MQEKNRTGAGVDSAFYIPKALLEIPYATEKVTIEIVCKDIVTCWSDTYNLTRCFKLFTKLVLRCPKRLRSPIPGCCVPLHAHNTIYSDRVIFAQNNTRINELAEHNRLVLKSSRSSLCQLLLKSGVC